MPARQRAVAGKTTHQLVSGLKRRRGQLRLDQTPEHARVVFDEIDGRQQRSPVEIATEPQLEVIRFGKPVEIDWTVQSQTTPWCRWPDRDNCRLRRIAANEVGDPFCEASELFRGFD